MRKGLKTTELWVNLAAMVIGALLCATGEENSWMQILGGIMATIAPASYTAGRSVVKGREALGAAHVEATREVAKKSVQA
tara:strand:+ start:652 stop:891 length:240 start_codon:yes stop_codon:yes gene_type:complete